MNNYRKWFFMALGILAVTVGLVGLVNYIVDPYGLLRKDFTWQFIDPNKNFIKTRYITENPERFDCLVMGSSRVNSIDVRKIPGYRAYNVHYSGGLPRDHLENIRYMLKKGVKLKLILLGLDEFSYKDDPDDRLYQPLRHPYPPVLDRHPLPFYLRYYFSFLNWEIMQVVLKGYMARLFGGSGDNAVYYDIYDTGQMYFYPTERQIEADPEKHRNDPKFLKHYNNPRDNLKGALQDLREIVRITAAHQVRLVLFINPLHKNVFLDAGADLDRFKRELSRLSSYYDFSGVNAVTTDNLNYLETSHYRGRVGDLVIARIFNARTVDVPEDFGRWVTRDNIELHLKALGQQADRLAASPATIGRGDHK